MRNGRPHKATWITEPFYDGGFRVFMWWHNFTHFIRNKAVVIRRRFFTWNVRHENDNTFKEKAGEVFKFITNILALCAVMLYPTSFWICEFLYPGDPTPDQWFILRDLHRGIVVMCLVLMNFMPRTKIRRAAMTAMIVFCAGNLVDRLIFGIHQYVIYDVFVWFWAVYIFVMKIRANDTGRT